MFGWLVRNDDDRLQVLCICVMFLCWYGITGNDLQSTTSTPGLEGVEGERDTRGKSAKIILSTGLMLQTSATAVEVQAARTTAKREKQRVEIMILEAMRTQGCVDFEENRVGS